MACRDAAAHIKTLSKERITQEMFKILSVDNPVDILEQMFDNNVLKEICFKKYNKELLSNLCYFQNNYGLQFLSSRLLILMGLDQSNMTALENYLLIPKVFKKDIDAMLSILSMPDLSHDHAIKESIYRFGRLPTAQTLMIELAQDRVMNSYAPKAIELVQNWDIPNFPVDGNDLIKAGIKKGPALGKALDKLETYWIDKKFRPDQLNLLSILEVSQQ